jgi:CHAT domain-containing protein
VGLGLEASEPMIADLAASGALERYRYLHFATHGVLDQSRPSRSALILSQVALPDPAEQFDKGLPVYDGKITVEEIVENWELDADLVVLSACNTALGRHAKGEGFIGFAQALLTAGARSVVLSLWKVDDTATSLLMDRFYGNLLGQTEGLTKPLPKAEALSEAKRWLRELPAAEATKLRAGMTAGVDRGKGRISRVDPDAPPPKPATPPGDKPYAHPYYWAAFILIGDPD